ncbi:MAG TPA: response regulator transcription factor [Candidatus Krumholzibacteria bacterium]|nr:response regulator transcription factor [Candidatus Krumholzibacteria bacterium]
MKIVIADDHAMIIEGLQLCFGANPAYEVVGVAEDGDRLMEMVERHRPDVAVLDITMPRMNGIEATREIVRRFNGETRCVILSMHRDGQYVVEAFRAGARGYIVKSSAFRELEFAVNSVMEGKTYVSPEVSDVLVGALNEPAPVGGGPSLSGLTRRERQTLQLLAEGLSVKEISYKFGVSHKTVHAYRASVLDKLQIDSLAGLTKFAIRHGITNVG